MFAVDLKLTVIHGHSLIHVAHGRETDGNLRTQSEPCRSRIWNRLWSTDPVKAMLVTGLKQTVIHGLSLSLVRHGPSLSHVGRGPDIDGYPRTQSAPYWARTWSRRWSNDSAFSRLVKLWRAYRRRNDWLNQKLLLIFEIFYGRTSSTVKERVVCRFRPVDT